MSRCQRSSLVSNPSSTVTPHKPAKREGGVMEINTTRGEDIQAFNFWVSMFSPRSDKWKADTLKRLTEKQSIFETEQERFDKIKALEYLIDNN
jgi:hypothetical protein